MANPGWDRQWALYEVCEPISHHTFSLVEFRPTIRMTVQSQAYSKRNSGLWGKLVRSKPNTYVQIMLAAVSTAAAAAAANAQRAACRWPPQVHSYMPTRCHSPACSACTWERQVSRNAAAYNCYTVYSSFILALLWCRLSNAVTDFCTEKMTADDRKKKAVVFIANQC